MPFPDTSLLIRNILILQLLTIAVAPEYAFQAHRRFLKMWKLIMNVFPHKAPADKKNRFWEIDMTKFEP